MTRLRGWRATVCRVGGVDGVLRGWHAIIIIVIVIIEILS